MKVAAIIQCTAGDIGNSTRPDDYVVDICLKSGLFDTVVMACPDLPASSRLEELAPEWDIGCFRGDEVNVAKRLRDCAQGIGADIVVRVLLRQFYLDMEQVGRMIRALVEAKADYVSLPADYNYALAADVCTYDALDRAVEAIEALPAGREQASFRFSPWVYMERYPDQYPVAAVDGGPAYRQEKSLAIREKYERIFTENQSHFAWNFPASSYRFLGAHLGADWRVLDIACGKGEGVRCLKDFCAEAMGVDLCEDYVERARAAYADMDGISYAVGDAETFRDDRGFDAVISLHTLEHLQKPEGFFDCTRHNLRDGGRLLIEVPLLLPHPMGMPLVPWHHKEYELKELVNAVKDNGFRIDELWLKQRHAFVELDANDATVFDNLPPKITAGLILATKLAEN